MRLAQLTVRFFRGIEHAEVELRPGLNLLHGPNETGKSTLAEAIRAALLCRARSSAAETYLPKLGLGAPEVSLTLADLGEDWLRIDKRFGDRPDTRLHRSSNRGQTWTSVGTGDGAETELRRLLRWGLRPPGGRGGPRGMESTFLTRALLAEQTEVDTLFDPKRGLEPDSTEQASFIQEALAAAMEDHRFKEALKQAQRHYDRYYSTSGQQRRGKTSPWTEVKQRLNAARAARDQARKASEDVAALEASLKVAQEELREARRRREAAESSRRALEVQLERARRREAVADACRTAESEHQEVVRKAAEVEALEQKLAALVQELADLRTAADEARARVKATGEDRERAESQLRALETSEGATQRELERVRLDGELSRLEREQEDLQRRVEEAQALRDQVAERIDLLSRIEAEAAARGGADSAEADARARAQRLELEATAARIAEADRRLNEAQEAQRQAAAEVEAATAAAEQAEQKGLIEEELSRRLKLYGDLDDGLVDRVRELRQTLDQNRARAGAGLSVRVDLEAPRAVEARLDDGEVAHHGPGSGPLELEAKRRIQLALPGVGHLEVVTGGPEDRERLRGSEAAWAAEGEPALARHGVTSVEALSQRNRDRGAELEKLREVRSERTRLDERASDLPRRRSALTKAEDALKAAAEARRRLPERVDATPSAPLAELEVERGRALAEANEAKEARIEHEATLRQLEPQAEQLVLRIREAEARLEAPAAELLERGPRRLRELDEEKAALTAKKEGLGKAHDRALAEASAALEAATDAVAAAEAALERAEVQLEAGQSAASETRGRLDSERSHLAALDGPARAARLEEARSALEAMPEVPAVTEEAREAADAEVEAAEARVEEAERDVHRCEGVLAQSEGALAEERAAEAEAIYEAAKGEEAKLETEGKASLLLLEVLKDAEKRASRHAGTYLGAAVTERFSELTGARYRGLEIDKTLVTSMVRLGETTLEPDQLSVGTRHQLATLLRVILAEKLGHPILLDDQLVQSDPERLAWFRDQLATSAEATQIIVLSCRPDEYAPAPGETIHRVDVAKSVQRFAGAAEPAYGDPTPRRAGPSRS